MSIRWMAKVSPFLSHLRSRIILQKYDEAVKRFNENKVQAKAKPAPKGGVGVTASMIVLEPRYAWGDSRMWFLVHASPGLPWRATVGGCASTISHSHFAGVGNPTNLNTTLIDPGCLAQPRHSSLELRQEKDLRRDVLSRGQMSKSLAG